MKLKAEKVCRRGIGRKREKPDRVKKKKTFGRKTESLSKKKEGRKKKEYIDKNREEKRKSNVKKSEEKKGTRLIKRGDGRRKRKRPLEEIDQINYEKKGELGERKSKGKRKLKKGRVKMSK